MTVSVSYKQPKTMVSMRTQSTDGLLGRLKGNQRSRSKERDFCHIRFEPHTKRQKIEYSVG